MSSLLFLIEFGVTSGLRHTIRQVSGEAMRENLKYLTEAMLYLKVLHRYVERRQAADQRLAIVARNITDLIYRVEDALDTLNLTQESIGLKVVNNEIEAEIDAIRSKEEYIRKSISIQGMLHDASATVDQSWRQTFGHQEDEHCVPRKEEMDELRELLTEYPQIRVVLICGMAGLGKTVLAQRLFQDDDIRKRFRQHLAWVHVSQIFNRRRVLVEVYTQLDPSHGERTISDISEGVLAERVGDILRKQRCLVVLDDVWSHNAREVIRTAFPFAGGGSKLLITTRESQVARAVRFWEDETYIHRLRYLTAAQSSALFEIRIDLHTHLPGIEANENSKMREEAINYCGGLPLAIISFVKLLESKQTEADWNILLQNLKLHVRLSQQSGNIESTMQSLSLSYNNLPDHLKPCFLYLGFLPHHPIVCAEMLFLFWVADGLLSMDGDSGEETLEDAAERYLYELAERTIIEVHEHEVPTFMRIGSYQLNPFYGDLSLLISEKQGFFKIVDSEGGRDQTAESFSQNQAYRFAINFDCDGVEYDSLLKDTEEKHVRCLLFSKKKSQKKHVWPKVLSTLVAFKYLRMLYFDGFDFGDTELPRGMENLIHLRYLSFNGCILLGLPSFIGKLRRLIVLDLRIQDQSKITIPNILYKLKKLVYLFLPKLFITKDGSKLSLKGLKELESIVNFNSGQLNFEDLFKLPKLRYVVSEIEGSTGDVRCIAEGIKLNPENCLRRASLHIKNFDCYTEDSHSLFRILLGWKCLVDLQVEGHLFRIPDHSSISQNIARLTLIGSELDEDPMRILERLPQLCVLVLDDGAFSGREMTSSGSSFVGLKQLQLLNLNNLVKWEVKEGAMPQLRMMELQNLKNLAEWVVNEGAMPELRRMKLQNLENLDGWEVKKGAMGKLSTLNIGNCGKLIMQHQELELIKFVPELKASRMHAKLKHNHSLAKKRYSVLGQVLGCPSLVVLCMSGYISQLPNLEIHSNLLELVLIGSELMEDSIKTLESFPNLQELVLKDDAYMGRKMICSGLGFMKLRKLEMQNLKNLAEWVANEGAMPELRKMELQNLENLERLEVEKGAMPKLSSLSIVNCWKLIMQAQELDLVKRVPEVKASGIHEEFKHNISLVKGDVMFEY